MATNSVTFNPNLSISTAKAAQLYGVTEEDLKLLNPDGDEKITAKEFQNYGINKNAGLREYFQAGTSAPKSVAAKPVSNPFGGSLKNNFRLNFNNGELSPEVTSDTVGKVFPRLYA